MPPQRRQEEVELAGGVVDDHDGAEERGARRSRAGAPGRLVEDGGQSGGPRVGGVVVGRALAPSGPEPGGAARRSQELHQRRRGGGGIAGGVPDSRSAA